MFKLLQMLYDMKIIFVFAGANDSKYKSTLTFVQSQNDLFSVKDFEGYVKDWIAVHDKSIKYLDVTWNTGCVFYLNYEDD